MDWRTLPPLSALRAFAAYAETRSVERAGAALNVSHAAISQQIRRLEEHLGTALVDRSSRALSLTADGAELAQALGEGFGTILAGVEAVARRETERPLMISVTPTFAAVWLVPRLARFRESHPEIDLMIDASAELRPLGRGGIDAALRYGDGAWPGLDAAPIVASPIAITAAPELVGNAVIKDPADLRAYPWLQEMGTSEASSWLAGKGGKHSPPKGLTSLPGYMLVEAARQGQGIAITSTLAVAEDIASGRLRLLFEEARDKGYFLVTRPGPQRPALRNFCRWVLKEAQAPAETISRGPS
ncbi:MAG: LysR family transcriptional regulator [Marinibacterium sp.]